ncbi:Uncharacterised protein [Serratia quinivorans]|nr:Uncharacterised protein [Serratia quinivorans]
MLVHFADQFFGEQTRLAGNADQNGGLGVTYYVQQRNGIALGLPCGQVFAFLHQLALEIEQVRQFVGQQTKTVNHEHAGARFVFAQTFGFHLGDNLLGNAAAGGTGTQEGHGLVTQLAARSAAGGNQATQRNRCGTLNIVVKAADFVTIAVQQRSRVVLSEILEL